MIGVFYYYGGKNFGDSINTVLFNTLAKKSFVYKKTPTEPHYMATGSVVHFSNTNSIIFGTGFISDTSTISNGIPSDIIAVRGPLTRNKFLKMNVKCPDIYGDPLLLFPLVYNSSIQVKPKTIGIIPHYIDMKSASLQTLITNLQRKYTVRIINIEVGTEYKGFIDSIAECETIISSSLHGMMMGIVYKKPTILVQFSTNVIGGLFKFNDFFGSLDISYTVKNVYTTDLLTNTIQVEYMKLRAVGVGLLRAAPFIDSARKNELIALYSKIYDHE
jgi:pyruvyltransferase